MLDVITGAVGVGLAVITTGVEFGLTPQIFSQVAV
jgi:hypothetical protein